MSAMGQPSQSNLQSGFESNYDPTVQDWQKAYQPVDKALNKAFETRITNKNARQVQFELAVVSLLPRRKYTGSSLKHQLSEPSHSACDAPYTPPMQRVRNQTCCVCSLQVDVSMMFCAL